MLIEGKPDLVQFGPKKVGAAGPGWMESTIPQWLETIERPDMNIALDMSNIEFVTLFEWVTTVAMLEKILANPVVTSKIAIDLVDTASGQVLPSKEYVPIKKGKKSTNLTTKQDYKLSERVYRVIGFLEALGTKDVLNRNRPGQVFYSGVKAKDADLQSYYRRRNRIGHTVVHPITRIGTKDDCKMFLDERQILNWRDAMGERFYQSPLFESEEFWRVLCHELAVNIWEHARATGFIAARVVELPGDPKKFRPWYKATYGELIGPLFKHMQHGFLELCVADAGDGFTNTLKQRFLEYTGRPENEVEPEDILAFAFDELGTCKNSEDSWATERHALGRILQIVAKYGGALRLRSGGAEVLYKSEGGRFERLRNNLGYKWQHAHQSELSLPGAQLQVILPLLPVFGVSQKVESRSTLDIALPRSFRTQQNQVRGHLVPLLEFFGMPGPCVESQERRYFRAKCIELNRELIKRPRNEPLVLDFSELNWNEGQVETLLHLLQNVLQHRPVLLVELSPILARGIEELERQSLPTLLEPEVLGSNPGAAGNAFDELSEKRFLETYNRVHATVLALDSNGATYIFGLPDYRYKELLLSLIHREASIEELCLETQWGETIRESVLRAILNPANPLFRFSKIGNTSLWSIVWSKQELANEASRVMSYHFDDVAKRSEAWLGQIDPPKPETGRDRRKETSTLESAKKKFYLPWLAKWREDFLEASRILSRSRQADEAAQRLIYRLRIGLEKRGKSLDDVKVLACVTTPAMLLAAAIHRWWPKESRPAVADLGYYVMLSEPEELPAITNSGGIVIVQDILDTKHVSNELIEALRRQPADRRPDILCVLGFVQLVTDLPSTRVTLLNEGWEPEGIDDIETFIPRHAMVQVRRPSPADEPEENEDDSNAFWIEPRILRAIPYPRLRREAPQDRYLERKNEYLEKWFDNPERKCLLVAGHYVFGRRHYAVTVNIREALTGPIGEELSHWLADICEGLSERSPKKWETKKGRSLEGGVTAVLMPLHSQIHYLWPQVENLLSQRGRRQPNWSLESTLFIGSGPAYFLPAQFRYQIQMAVKDAIMETEEGMVQIDPKTPMPPLIKHPLRILIIDDAIATAQTAETVLTTILREVEGEFDKAGKKAEECLSPIEWIRYFAVLNQMGHTQLTFWHSLPVIGKRPIKIVFEEFAPFMGVPIFDEENCPTCADRVRLKQLIARCQQQITDALIQQWAERRFVQLQPIAVDSPDFQGADPERLPHPIDILTARRTAPPQKYQFIHADTAIWRFYELMYLSYPPNDVLLSLDGARPGPEATDEQVKEFDRYRWAVLEWCLHNWSRMKANAARDRFIEYAKKEVDNNTSLIELILEGASIHYRDPFITTFIADLIVQLAELEKERYASDERVIQNDRIETTVRLNIGLTIFFLNISVNELPELTIGEHNKYPNSNLIEHLDNCAKPLDRYGHSFLRNLHRRLTRPQRYAKPTWALEALAESLFRGREENAPDGTHKLLPKLISNVLSSGGGDAEDRHLLHGSLSLFLAALEDIKPYSNLTFTPGATEIEADGKTVLEWLKHPAESHEGAQIPSALRDLSDAIHLSSDFCTRFRRIFHLEVEELRDSLEKIVKARSRGLLEFEFAPDEDVKKYRVLTHVHRLIIYLANRTIDPVVDRPLGAYKSKIKVRRLKDDNGEDRVRFRLLTNFEKLNRSQELINQGRSGDADRHMLVEFGARFEKELVKPTSEERAAGYEAAYEFDVMTGFVPKKVRNEL